MSYLGSWKIDDYLYFYCNTHDPDTGVATDADSAPTYRVYENETGAAILNGSMALLDDGNTTGFYSEEIQLTAANGFEKGKQYAIYISATVDSDTGTMHHTFQMEAEVDANTVSATGVDANVKQISDDATAADDLELFIESAKGTDDKVLISTDAQDLSATLDVNVGAMDTGVVDAAAIATDAITSDELATSALNEIADAILARGVGNTEDSADPHSLCAIVLATLEWSISGQTWTIKKVDGATTFVTKTISQTEGADPVTGVT